MNITNTIINFKIKNLMSIVERQENKMIEKMVGKPSSGYLSARRANIPVTVVRGETIYRVTKEGKTAIGSVAPKVKVNLRTVVLK